MLKISAITKCDIFSRCCTCLVLWDSLIESWHLCSIVLRVTFEWFWCTINLKACEQVSLENFISCLFGENLLWMKNAWLIDKFKIVIKFEISLKTRNLVGFSAYLAYARDFRSSGLSVNLDLLLGQSSLKR